MSALANQTPVIEIEHEFDADALAFSAELKEPIQAIEK
jgi:hypothetical protein